MASGAFHASARQHDGIDAAGSLTVATADRHQSLGRIPQASVPPRQVGTEDEADRVVLAEAAAAIADGARKMRMGCRPEAVERERAVVTGQAESRGCSGLPYRRVERGARIDAIRGVREWPRPLGRVGLAGGDDGDMAHVAARPSRRRVQREIMARALDAPAEGERAGGRKNDSRHRTPRRVRGFAGACRHGHIGWHFTQYPPARFKSILSRRGNAARCGSWQLTHENGRAAFRGS